MQSLAEPHLSAGLRRSVRNNTSPFGCLWFGTAVPTGNSARMLDESFTLRNIAHQHTSLVIRKEPTFHLKYLMTRTALLDI